MKVILYSIAVMFLCSCNAIRKSQDANKLRKAKEQMLLHKDAFAGTVAAEFPCIPLPAVHDTTTNDSAYRNSMMVLNDYIVYMQGYYDSILLIKGVDTAMINLVQTQGNQIATLKQGIKNIKPVIKEIPVPYQVEDTRKLEAMRQQSGDKDKTIATQVLQIGKVTGKWSWWMWACLITWGVIALAGIIWIISKLK